MRTPPLKQEGLARGPLHRAGAFSYQSGFTLLEIIAVIAILAGLMAIVLPRFAALGTVMLKSDAGRVGSLLRYTGDAAATRGHYFRVVFDLENESISVEESDDAEEYRPASDPAMRSLVLARGVEITDLTTEALGRVERGTVGMVFAPGGATGGAGPFSVHLASSGQTRTITYNPYSGRVKVREGYL